MGLWAGAGRAQGAAGDGTPLTHMMERETGQELPNNLNPILWIRQSLDLQR